MSRLLRALANVKPGPGGPTDAEQLKVPSTSLVVQAARLRYPLRLLRHALPSLRSPLWLPSASQWRQTFVTDISELSQVLSSKVGRAPGSHLGHCPVVGHGAPFCWTTEIPRQGLRVQNR